MACIINADNGAISGSAGVKTTADSTGVLNIQTNGTTAISISASQAVSFTNTPTFTGGTANGVLYLNGSKVATSGTALTFDGTNLALAGGNSATQRINIYASGSTAQYLAAGNSNTGLNGTLFGVDGTGNAVINNTQAFGVIFSTSNTERARLDTSGNLGIGTASPGYRLTVSGGATSLAANQYLRFGAGLFASSDGSVDNYLFTGSTALRWRNSADNTELMQLTNTGNLGIGTSSPAVKLDVQRGSEGEYLRVGGDDTGNNGRALRFTSSTGGGFIGAMHTLNAPSSGGTIAFATNNTERARLDSSGNLGIGTSSPSGKIATQVTASGTFQNAFVASDGTSSDLLVRIRTNETQLMNSGASVLSFGTSNTERARITSGGDLLVGVTTGSYHILRKAVTNDGGNTTVEFQSTGGSTSQIWYGVSGFNANAANAATKVGRDATTLRSINAGGTVNASGADYAEYMTKAGEFALAKGDVCGIDADGKLTNVFANAISFVVKSTDPSYVGGDSWGANFKDDPEGLEAARQKVDRIAFAGQVPVNVLGATPGQYIVPINDNGAIKGVAVSNPTFEQYQSAVGKVIAVQDDGRALIIVKVA